MHVYTCDLHCAPGQLYVEMVVSGSKSTESAIGAMGRAAGERAPGVGMGGCPWGWRLSRARVNDAERAQLSPGEELSMKGNSKDRNLRKD